MEESSKIYLTKKGYEEHLKQIEELKSSLLLLRLKRGCIDDLKNIIEIEEFQSEETRIVTEIMRMNEELTRVVIVDKQENDEIVDIDDIILVDMIAGSLTREMMLKLVGTDSNIKADIQEVSINSPVGKAIYGKKIGELCSYSVNNRNMSLLIKSKVDMSMGLESKKKTLKK